MKLWHLFLFTTALWATSAQAAPYQIISVTEQIIGQFKYTETVVQNGSDSRDRFKMHRVVKNQVPEYALKNPIILLPSLGNNFTSYTVGLSAAGTDFNNSLAANLASKNIDVWGYSPRVSQLAPGSCGTTVDCSIAANWGIASRADDVEFIRQQIQLVHHHDKPVVGGHSLGGMLATAIVNQNPNGYDGVLLVDATLVINDAGLQANYQVMCNGIRAAITAGQAINDQLNPPLIALMQLSVSDPNGATPFPGFPPGTTNRQAFLFVMTSPSMGPPQSLFPNGAILAAGSVAENRFFFASENVLNNSIARFDYYVTNAELADVVCSFAGETTFTNNLSNFNGAVLAFEATAGFGPFVEQQLALFTNADDSLVVFNGFGHTDPVMLPNRKKHLDKPIIRWLRTEVSKRK